MRAPVNFFPFPSILIFLVDEVGLLLFCVNSTAAVTVRSDITLTATLPETPFEDKADVKSAQVAKLVAEVVPPMV